MKTFEIYDSSEPLLSRAAPALQRQEAFNGLILGFLLSGAPAYNEKYFMMVSDGDQVELIAMRTPPFNLAIALTGEHPKETLDQLAEELFKLGHDLPGITGPDEWAQYFGNLWCEKTGKSMTCSMAQRIYELTKVTWPEGVLGKMRLAEMKDLDLMVTYREGFHQDTGAIMGAEDIPIRITREINEGNLVVWEDGGVVSTAVAIRETPKGICIGGVFTPEDKRRRGYAGALVASLSQFQLDKGKSFCCLYTDLANPTSNSIYQKIGYQSVGDSGMYSFE